MNELLEKIYAERGSAKENKIAVLRDNSLKLLLTYVSALKPKKILEIGTAWGLTGIAMLAVSENSVLYGIERDPECIGKSSENYKKYGVEKRVNFFKGDAEEIIPLMSGSFDFIFLDGPKGHYAKFLPYLKNMLAVNGVLFADDVAFHGYVSGENTPNIKNKHNTIIASLKKFIKGITEDEDLLTVILSEEDGVSVTVRLK